MNGQETEREEVLGGTLLKETPVDHRRRNPDVHHEVWLWAFETPYLALGSLGMYLGE